MDLEALVDELAPRVVRYCRSAVGEASLGDEVAQEALTALVRQWRLHGPPECPAAFVFTVARRRSARARFRLRLWAPLDALGAAPDGGRGPEQALLGEELRLRVRWALAKLPRPERDAILLVAAGEITTAEAAQVLGLSASAVKMRVFRGRQRMLDMLGDGHGPR